MRSEFNFAFLQPATNEMKSSKIAFAYMNGKQVVSSELKSTEREMAQPKDYFWIQSPPNFYFHSCEYNNWMKVSSEPPELCNWIREKPNLLLFNSFSSWNDSIHAAARTRNSVDCHLMSHQIIQFFIPNPASIICPIPAQPTTLRHEKSHNINYHCHTHPNQMRSHLHEKLFFFNSFSSLVK